MLTHGPKKAPPCDSGTKVKLRKKYISEPN